MALLPRRRGYRGASEDVEDMRGRRMGNRGASLENDGVRSRRCGMRGGNLAFLFSGRHVVSMVFCRRGERGGFKSSLDEPWLHRALLSSSSMLTLGITINIGISILM